MEITYGNLDPNDPIDEYIVGKLGSLTYFEEFAEDYTQGINLEEEDLEDLLEQMKNDFSDQCKEAFLFDLKVALDQVKIREKN